IGAEARQPPEPLEEGERRGRVVAHAVEAVGEGQVRGRALPAVPAKTGGLERRAQGPWREVEEMLARLVVVPKPSEQARLQATDIGRDQMHDAAGDEEPAYRGERRDWIGEVLDGVVERDHIEARLRQVQLFEPTRGDAQPTLARALGRERRDLYALDIPARGLRLEKEIAEGAADVQ